MISNFFIQALSFLKRQERKTSGNKMPSLDGRDNIRVKAYAFSAAELI